MVQGESFTRGVKDCVGKARRALVLTAFTQNHAAQIPEGSHDDSVDWGLVNGHSSFENTASGGGRCLYGARTFEPKDPPH